MAAFMGRMQRHRGEATHLGSRASGIVSDVKSWEIRVSVQGSLDSATGEERIDIVARDIASGAKLEIGLVSKVEGRLVFEPAPSIDFSPGGEWHQWASSLEAKNDSQGVA